MRKSHFCSKSGLWKLNSHFHNAWKECLWSKKILNFIHRFKSAILAKLKNCQNGTFKPVHEIQKNVWPKAFQNLVCTAYYTLYIVYHLDGQVCVKFGFVGPLFINKLIENTMELLLRINKLKFSNKNLKFHIHL